MGQFIIRFECTSEFTGKTRRQRTEPMSLEDAVKRFNELYAADKAANPQRGRVTVQDMTVTVKVPREGVKTYRVLPYTDWSPLSPEN